MPITQEECLTRHKKENVMISFAALNPYMQKIPFTARFINEAFAQKIYADKDKKEPCSVSFIELNPRDLNDVSAAAIASENWGLPEYSEVICNRMEFLSNHTKKYNPNVEKFYAITAQQDDFDNPNPSEILALCSVNNNKNVRIKFLQVKPKECSDFKIPFFYNRIGTGMLDSIKKIFQNKKIQLYSTPQAVPFYIANGFKESKDNYNEFSYEA